MQLDLQFTRSKGPTTSEDEVAGLLIYLRGKGWTRATQIAADLGLKDRKIRALAAASAGLIVSGPGSPGYKHVQDCTPEEISAAVSTLEHQAKLMATRAGKIRAQWHRAAN